MNCARNCENLFNFIKVMPKILLLPFFPDTVYMLKIYESGPTLVINMLKFVP